MFAFDNAVKGKLSMRHHAMEPRQRDGKGLCGMSWQVLSLLVVVSLVLGLLGLARPAGATALAADQGEQTAKLLPADIDYYLTVDLDPSEGQLAKFRSFLNNWWQNPDVQTEWDKLLKQAQDESGIDIEQDVFPWLGPELAMGMSLPVPAREEQTDAEMVFLIGTMDKDASDAFFFDKLASALEDEEFPTHPSGDYKGIDVVYTPEEETYWAFPEEYIVFSNNQSFLEESLDLMITPNTDASLGGSPDFRKAQASLPDRAGMLYYNYAHLWEQSLSQIPAEDNFMFEAFGNSIPSCIAASLQFASNGMVTTAYYPLSKGMTPPIAENDLLRSARIVPSDAWLFLSGQNVNASWYGAEDSLAKYLKGVTANIDDESDFPEGMTKDDIASPDALSRWVEKKVGLNINRDIFGWMTGEYSLALLPLSFDEYGSTFPDLLLLFEVENPAEVNNHLTAIIDAINKIIEESTSEDETPDRLRTSATSIGGVEATRITNNAMKTDDGSPGWLFLDIDNTHYLVIGTTTGALEAAVAASEQEILSLDEAEEYRGVMALLLDTKTSLAYSNLSQIFNAIVSQASSEYMSRQDREDFERFVRYLPLQCAVGSSGNAGSADAVIGTGVLYLLPPPLTEQTISRGTTGRIEIPEQTFDFSNTAPDVGRCAVSISIDDANAQQEGNIKVTAMEELPVGSGFELAAARSGANIADTAYGIKVDKINLTDDSIGTATITMKVNRAWADNQGTDNVKIFRISEGACEVLPTVFTGYQENQAVFVGTSANGLSYFALVATSSEKSETHWALIGGIIAGVLVIAAVVMVLSLRRRRAVPEISQ